MKKQFLILALFLFSSIFNKAIAQCNVTAYPSNNCSLGGQIDSFVLNGVVSPGSHGCSAQGPNGYGFFANPIWNVTIGQANPFYAYLGSQNANDSENFAIWIDLNNNNVYEASEMIYHTTTAIHGGLSGTITIPTTTTSAINVNMRIRSALKPYVFSGNDACISNVGNYGETEDHFVNIVGSIPTNGPSFLGANINHLCNGPQIVTQISVFSSNYSVKTWFGDGSYSISGLSPSTNGGYSTISHAYTSQGTFTIKQKLYNTSNSNPIDSIQFSYQNVSCESILVKFYNDANNNCFYDSTESYITQPILTEVDANGIPIDTISSTSGFYYAGTPGTIYSFKVISLPATLCLACPASGILSVTLQAGVNPDIMFGLKCSSITNYDLSVHRTMQGTGHHSQVGTIFVQNNSCTPTNATVTLYYSPKYQFSGANITPTTVSATSVTWNMNGLSSSSGLPNELQYYLETMLTMYLPSLPIGDTVNTICTVTPVIGDCDTGNNHCGGVDTVKGSFDPNMMLVTPTDTIAAGTILKYFIEFENDGNDTAHNVYVMDTLSDNIVLNSLAIESASAVMDISVFNDGSHNIARFDFPKINLLDSSHHGACTGYVQFYIKSRTALPIGTHIYNRAGIFFDDNDVVMTNTVDNIIGGQTATVSSVKAVDNVSVFPNPTKDNIVIQTSKKYDTYSIINSIGQTILHQPLNSTQATVDVSMLPAGVYQVLLQGSTGTAVARFVKM